MEQEKEPGKNESQQPLTPAGEARGEDLPPQRQGGPHLPDISEPASLTDQFESESGLVDVPVRVPVKPEKPHQCSICQGTDHRACGCEAKEQKAIEQDNNPGLAQIEKELDREDANAAQVLDKSVEVLIGKASELSPVEMMKIFGMAGRKLAEDMKCVLDVLTDQKVALDMIVSQLDVMIEAERNRADLFKDLQNAGAKPNQN